MPNFRTSRILLRFFIRKFKNLIRKFIGGFLSIILILNMRRIQKKQNMYAYLRTLAGRRIIKASIIWHVSWWVERTRLKL